VIEPMRTGTPMALLACASSAPRKSPIRGTIHACRTTTDSASRSHAAISKPNSQRAVTAVILSRREGGDAVSFIEDRAVSGIMTASIQRGSTETDSSVNQLPATSTSTAQIAFSSYSRFVQRLRRRYAAELALLPPARRGANRCRGLRGIAPTRRRVGDALRIVRQLVMERLVTLDCDQQAPLAVVTTAVTELAEFALDIACADACRELDAVHGAPLGPEGQRAQLWVVGMGKLGARELNVSSDIDLIYLYDLDGETQGDADGRGPLSNQEYFSRAVKRIYALVGDTTEHGFVFRVDLALRPNGNSGPERGLARCARGIFPGAGPRVGALRLDEEPRGGAARHRARGRRRACAARCCPSCSAATSTTACSIRCARCTGRSASSRRAAAPAGPSAPTT
jgi:hypothetical protein